MNFEVVQAPDGSSAYIDIALPGYKTRATVGRLGMEQGYCDMEVLNTETEEAVHWQHQEFASSMVLNIARAGFVNTLGALPSAAVNSSAFALPLADKLVRLNGRLEPLFATAEH